MMLSSRGSKSSLALGQTTVSSMCAAAFWTFTMKSCAAAFLGAFLFSDLVPLEEHFRFFTPTTTSRFKSTIGKLQNNELMVNHGARIVPTRTPPTTTSTIYIFAFALQHEIGRLDEAVENKQATSQAQQEKRNLRGSVLTSAGKFFGLIWDLVPQDKMKEKKEAVEQFFLVMQARRAGDDDPQPGPKNYRKLLDRGEKLHYIFEKSAGQDVMFWTSEQILHINVKEGWPYYWKDTVGTEQPQTKFSAMRWSAVLSWCSEPVGTRLDLDSKFTLETETDSRQINVSVDVKQAFELHHFLSWRLLASNSLHLPEPAGFSKRFAAAHEPCDLENFKQKGHDNGNGGILSTTQLFFWKAGMKQVDPACTQAILREKKVLLHDERVELALASEAGAVDLDTNIRDAVIFTNYRILKQDVPDLLEKHLTGGKANYISYLYSAVRAWTFHTPGSFLDWDSTVVIHTKIYESRGDGSHGPRTIHLNIRGGGEGGTTFGYETLWGVGTSPLLVTHLLSWRVLGNAPAAKMGDKLLALVDGEAGGAGAEQASGGFFDWLLQLDNGIRIRDKSIVQDMLDNFLTPDAGETVDMAFDSATGMFAFTNKRLVIKRNKLVDFGNLLGGFLGNEQYISIDYNAIQSFALREKAATEKVLPWGEGELFVSTDVPGVYIPPPDPEHDGVGGGEVGAGLELLGEGVQLLGAFVSSSFLSFSEVKEVEHDAVVDHDGAKNQKHASPTTSAGVVVKSSTLRPSEDHDAEDLALEHHLTGAMSTSSRSSSTSARAGLTSPLSSEVEPRTGDSIVAATPTSVSPISLVSTSVAEVLEGGSQSYSYLQLGGLKNEDEDVDQTGLVANTSPAHEGQDEDRELRHALSQPPALRNAFMELDNTIAMNNREQQENLVQHRDKTARKTGTNEAARKELHQHQQAESARAQALMTQQREQQATQVSKQELGLREREGQMLQFANSVAGWCTNIDECRAAGAWDFNNGLREVMVDFRGSESLLAVHAYLSFRLTRVSEKKGAVAPPKEDTKTWRSIVEENEHVCEQGSSWFQSGVSWLANQYYQEEPETVKQLLMARTLEGTESTPSGGENDKNNPGLHLFLPGEKIHFGFTAQNRHDILLFTSFRILHRDYDNTASTFFSSTQLTSQGSRSRWRSIPYDEIHYWKLSLPGKIDKHLKISDEELTLHYGLKMSPPFKFKVGCADTQSLYRFLSAAIIGRSEQPQTTTQNLDTAEGKSWSGGWWMVDSSDQFRYADTGEATAELREKQPRVLLDYEKLQLAYRKPRDFLVFPEKHRFLFKDVIGPFGEAMQLHSWKYEKVVSWEVATQVRQLRSVFGRRGVGAGEGLVIHGTRWEAPGGAEKWGLSGDNMLPSSCFNFLAPAAGSLFVGDEAEDMDIFDAFFFFEENFARPPPADANQLLGGGKGGAGRAR
ncbi:unnamed protein product [Amoebophrya sp. A120]|nr:unnamed protein product [Amoebophrya sp. A120]|eukprot:GSA120T00017301001.1